MVSSSQSLLAIIFTLAFSVFVLGDLSQETIDNIANKLVIRYDVIDNLDSESTFKCQLTLKNTGNKPISKGNWVIYFCSIRLVEPDHLKHNPRGYVIPGVPGIRFYHINGCLHKLEPTDDFQTIEVNKEMKFEFLAQFWEVAITDVMPNWYIAAKGLEARVIQSTHGEDLSFVGPFDSKEKWKRSKNDLYNPYTTEQRYDRDDIKNLGTAPLKLVPTPVLVTDDKEGGSVKLNTGDWKIVVNSDSLQSAAKILSDKYNMKITNTNQTSAVKTLNLATGDPDVTLDGKKSTSPDAYFMKIYANEPHITITGKEESGVFYGIQSLLSLAGDDGIAPAVEIKDAPRYEYRGLHLDVGRNFFRKEEVLKLLDAMAMYKLNKFHFHLSDDEGWRLEIPGLDELTTVGSRRCFDPTGKKCLLSQLGSGPDSTTSGSGHYTVSDYKEILKHAADRFIQVIPEFDMPGHGYAAIKSMEAKGSKDFLLTEANDNSSYFSIQMFTDDAINPCLESTYNFVRHLVKELVAMHNETQPLTTFHFGGDEVARGVWVESPSCKLIEPRLNSSEKTLPSRLMEYFVQRVSNITSSYNLNLAGWEDGLLNTNHVPYKRQSMRNKEVYAYAWNNVWEWGGGNRAYTLANAGYKVVMSQATHLYFDHPYEPDPEERGYYWATRYTDTRKTFGFMPDDVYGNIQEKRFGEKLSRDTFCAKPDKCTNLTKPENIAGMAGALWSETVRTGSQLQAMVFPRLLALAERAWHKASWENNTDEAARDTIKKRDWEQFANTLGYKELARLDKMGISYHIPPPGARTENSELKVRVNFPGLAVQYSEDGGKTWKEVTGSSKVRQGKIQLRTRSANKTRVSRIVTLHYRGGAGDFTLSPSLICLAIICTIVGFIFQWR